MRVGFQCQKEKFEIYSAANNKSLQVLIKGVNNLVWLADGLESGDKKLRTLVFIMLSWKGWQVINIKSMDHV